MVSFQMLSDWKFQRAVISGRYFNNVPLYDKVFDIMPNLTSIPKLPDYFIQSFLVLTILFNVLLRDRQSNPIKYGGLLMLRRLMFIMGFVYFLRGFAFFVTTLPNAKPECVLRYPTGYWTNYFVLLVQMITGSVMACTDNIYSGHTAMATVCLLTFHIYQSRVWVIVGAYVLFFATLFAIVSTHLHYTVDVFVAIIIAASIYLSYHYLVILALDDLYFTQKLGHTPQTLAGFSWQERNKLMQFTKSFLIRTVAWADGISIRFKYAPTHLVRLGRVHYDGDAGQSSNDSLANALRSNEVPLYGQNSRITVAEGAENSSSASSSAINVNHQSSSTPIRRPPLFGVAT